MVFTSTISNCERYIVRIEKELPEVAGDRFIDFRVEEEAGESDIWEDSPVGVKKGAVFVRGNPANGRIGGEMEIAGLQFSEGKAGGGFGGLWQNGREKGSRGAIERFE